MHPYEGVSFIINQLWVDRTNLEATQIYFHTRRHKESDNYGGEVQTPVATLTSLFQGGLRKTATASAMLGLALTEKQPQKTHLLSALIIHKKQNKTKQDWKKQTKTKGSFS